MLWWCAQALERAIAELHHSFLHLQGSLVIKELPFKEPSAGLLAGLGPDLRSGAGWVLDRHRLNNDCT